MKDRLTAGEIFELLEGNPLQIQESAVVMPSKGGRLFADDGSMKVAIIRPCVSRGKRINGQPPIYTPRMLSENAAVFTDWPMYQDHMAEQALDNFREQLAEAQLGDVIEFLEERARRIKELGGRVERSYWNPEITFEDDGEFGYQKGGIEGVVFPQRAIREMLEDDPKILNVSINAWPTGARPGTAPWDQSARGMLIEGIRRKPRGSVDWVFRGGAGGRPLLEDGDLAVSVLEAYYAAEHGQGPLNGDDDLKEKLQQLKPGDLAGYLREEAPHLLEALKEPGEPAPKGNGGGNGGSPLTEERMAEMLSEQRTQLEENFDQRLRDHDAEVDRRVQEREGARGLSDHAYALIREAERNGFPHRWAENLRARYAVLPTGPAEGVTLQEADLTDAEGNTLTAEQVVEGRVKADIQECLRLIEDAGGRPAPRGLGASAPDKGGEGGTGSKAPKDSAFREHLRESGDLQEGDDAPSEDEQVKALTAKARL